MMPDAARVRNALRLQRADRGQRGEDRVAVVGAAATVELAVLDQRRPRAAIGAPADHFRLLVEMAVQQHRALAAAGHLEEQHRRAPGQAHDLDGESRDRLRARPFLGEPDHALDVAVRSHAGSKCGDFAGMRM